MTYEGARSTLGRVCRAPGCGLALSDASRSGVCRIHNHGPWCGCTGCLNKRRKQGLGPFEDGPTKMPDHALPARQRKPPKDGVYQVLVAYPTSNSGVAGKMPVSLPKPKWME